MKSVDGGPHRNHRPELINALRILSEEDSLARCGSGRQDGHLADTTSGEAAVWIESTFIALRPTLQT
jgi:hypothetical protein